MVGADWAERRSRSNLLVDATPDEDAVAEELEDVWLHPDVGSSPVLGRERAALPLDAGQGLPLLTGRAASDDHANGSSAPRTTSPGEAENAAHWSASMR